MDRSLFILSRMNAMKNIIKLLCVVLFIFVPLVGCSDDKEPIDEMDETVQKEQNLIRSMMKLVLLENVETVEGIKAAQDAYLNDHYKDYEYRGGNMYGTFKGLYIQSIGVHNKKGLMQLLSFDMTDIYKKLEKSNDEATRKKVKELIRRHGDLEK